MGSVYVASASQPGECDSIVGGGCGTCRLFDSDVAIQFQVAPEGSMLFHSQRAETISKLPLVEHCLHIA